jgi:hypothetical protein
MNNSIENLFLNLNVFLALKDYIKDIGFIHYKKEPVLIIETTKKYNAFNNYEYIADWLSTLSNDFVIFDFKYDNNWYIIIIPEKLISEEKKIKNEIIKKIKNEKI